MADFILLMHRLNKDETTLKDWNAYIDQLSSNGQFRGGSSIGNGICLTKNTHSPSIFKHFGITQHIGGFIRIEAQDLESAKQAVIGNPVFEAGGTVEIRELTED